MLYFVNIFCDIPKEKKLPWNSCFRIFQEPWNIPWRAKESQWGFGLAFKKSCNLLFVFLNRALVREGFPNLQFDFFCKSVVNDNEGRPELNIDILSGEWYRGLRWIIFVFLKIKTGQYIQLCLMSLPAVLFAVHAKKSLVLEAQNTRRHVDMKTKHIWKSTSRLCQAGGATQQLSCV